MASGIYQITNTVTGRFYIGSGIDLDKRFKQHQAALKSNRHYNYYIQRSYNKHGSDVFTYKTIEYVDDVNKLIEREQYYIDTLGAYNTKNGFNLSPTAGSTLGMPCREDVKEKISNALKGKYTGKNSFIYGLKRSDETREKMKNCNKVNGERHGKATTTEKQAIQVKKLLAEGVLTGVAIANKVGISKGVVYSIKNEQAWKHLKINE